MFHGNNVYLRQEANIAVSIVIFVAYFMLNVKLFYGNYECFSNFLKD